MERLKYGNIERWKIERLKMEPKVTDRAFAVCVAGANIKAKEVKMGKIEPKVTDC